MKRWLICCAAVAIAAGAALAAWVFWPRTEAAPEVTVRTLTGLKADERLENGYVTCDGRLVVCADNCLLVFANGDRTAAVSERIAIPDLARRLGLDDNLPVCVRDYQCALSLMNIPAAAPRGPLYVPGEVNGLYSDNDCKVHQILDERRHRMASKTFTQTFVKEEPAFAYQSGWLENRPNYKLRPDLATKDAWIVWGQTIEPIVHTWDGRETNVLRAMIALEDPTASVSFGALLPFRHTRMCLRLGVGIATSYEGDKPPDDTDIVIRISPTGLRKTPTTVTIPAKGKYLTAWFDGFDGSVSVILLDDSKYDPQYGWYHEYLWYHIR